MNCVLILSECYRPLENSYDFIHRVSAKAEKYRQFVATGAAYIEIKPARPTELKPSVPSVKYFGVFPW